MIKRSASISLWALTLAVAALPRVEAQALSGPRFQTGRLLQVQPQGVSQSEAQQLVGYFMTAIHQLASEGGNYAWIIYASDQRTPLAICPQVQQDQDGGLLFAGQMMLGPIYGKAFLQHPQYGNIVGLAIPSMSGQGYVIAWWELQPLQNTGGWGSGG